MKRTFSDISSIWKESLVTIVYMGGKLSIWSKLLLSRIDECHMQENHNFVIILYCLSGVTFRY